MHCPFYHQFLGIPLLFPLTIVLSDLLPSSWCASCVKHPKKRAWRGADFLRNSTDDFWAKSRIASISHCPRWCSLRKICTYFVFLFQKACRGLYFTNVHYLLSTLDLRKKYDLGGAISKTALPGNYRITPIYRRLCGNRATCMLEAHYAHSKTECGFNQVRRHLLFRR